MKEDDDLWASAELPYELCEDNRNHIADFVKEDSHAVDFRDHPTTEGGCEFDFPRGGCSQEMRGLEAVLSL